MQDICQHMQSEPRVEPVNRRVDLQLGTEARQPLERRVQLSGELTLRLGAASALAGHDLDSALIAALATVVAKCIGQRELTVRHATRRGVADVRVRVAADARFCDLAEQVANGLREATASPHARFLAGDLVLHRLEADSEAMPLIGSGASVFGVRAPGAALELSVCAPVAPERRHALESLLHAYAQVIEQCAADYRAALREVRLVGESARKLLLETLNRTQTLYHPRTIHAIFEEQVALLPGRLAVHDGRTSLTYEELNRRANRVATALRRRGVERNSICGILVDRSVDWCVAIFGILKAGGAFLPIDASHPRDRIASMLQSSGCRLVLTQPQHAPMLQDLSEALDLPALALGPAADTNPPHINTAADLAYVIYTSGSTGIPKGVPIAHEGIASFDQHYKDSFQFTRDDNVLNFFSPSFDGSISELTMALLAGTGFYILPEEVKGSYRRFEQYLNEHRITVATIPPPYLRYLDPLAFQTLHTIFVAGSESTKALLDTWSSRYSVVNHYGPTEVTICASEWKSPRAPVPYSSVPIGRPIANKRVYILDANLELQPFGLRGELCVSGVRISDGYLNQPELTAQKFLPNPFVAELPDASQHALLYRTGDSARWFEDGNIEFLGRIDDQVKVRGYRVELGEVEQAMLGLAGVTEATVLARADDSGENALYGFYAASAAHTAELLRTHLAARLPSYMIPNRLLRVDSMPLTGSDKVDKKQLEALLQVAENEPAVVAARDDGSDAIARDVLQYIVASCDGPAGRHIELADELESLGINSLRFIKLIMQLEDRFGFEVEGEFFVGRKGLTVGDIVRETQRRVSLP